MAKKKPQLKVEYIPIGKLKPFKGNPRKNEAAVGEIVRSIEHYGYTSPILVRRANNEVIAGHTRLLALKETGAEKAPVIYLDMTAKEARAYGIFDNKSTENTEWDVPKLTDLIEQLTADGVDFEDLGFTEDELAEMQPVINAEPDPQDDIVPDAPKTPKTRTGDLYLLGEHRLLCGDATKAEDVERRMCGEKADMVFTDPPYNVSYQDNESIESLKKRNRRTDGKVVSNDSMTDEQFAVFLLGAFNQFPLRKGGVFYTMAPAGPSETIFRNALDAARELTLKACLVWIKDVFVFGRQDYHYRHESMLYGWREGAAHYFVDDRTQNTAWDILRPRTSKEHPTMKPVELVERAISNSSVGSEVVYDPFLGSGTTIIAAEKLGRKCFGLEIDETYCDVIVKRWEEFTGQKAERVRAKRAG